MYSKRSILRHIKREVQFRDLTHAVPSRIDGDGKNKWDGFSSRQLQRPSSSVHYAHPCPNCSSTNIKFYGYTKCKTQRLACKSCGKTFSNSNKIIGSMRIDSVRQARAKGLFLKGESIRCVASAVEISNNTAMKIRRYVICKTKCKCGKISGHKGWCKWRFSKSKIRQETLKTMRESKVKSKAML